MTGIVSITFIKGAFAAPTLSGTSTESVSSSALQAPINSETNPVNNTDQDNIVGGSALMNNHNPSPDQSISGRNSDSSGDQISVYVVRDGDTLSTIANMFGITENTIRWANDINSKSTIKPGQELIILPISGIKYTVKKGDNLKSIASSFNSDPNDILLYNNLGGPEDISAGDEIIIPNGEIVANIPSVPNPTTPTKHNSDTKPTNTSTKPTQSRAPSSGTSPKTNGSWLMRPIRGGIKTQGIHGHNGVDLASALNTPIMAAASGKVIIAKFGGWNGGYGNYVVISHPNGIQTLYAHMNSVDATVGENVTQGEVIGKMGHSGQVSGTTGIHLHFEVRGGVNPF